ncbi:uncharacterized protein LOC111905507 [Lactuca sativa]|uniref:uncharacterized protein LOC111905507 n=1 Tax=Lactuca sativa TaxID=4236 RepID=UPI000CD9BBEC|nr:uncharacterized protein LOC111905507 [Lactuca sativa]
MDAYYLEEKYRCIFFPTNMLGPARLWYQSLPVESIHYFNYLREEFIGHFVQQRRYTTDAHAILGCKQREDETLHAIVHHFNTSSINSPESVANMVIVVFTYGLHPGVLFKKQVGKPPKSRKDMMERVHHYMKQKKKTREREPTFKKITAHLM